MPIRLSGWLVVLLIISACSSQRIETSIPTQTLIPPTITSTATPIIPTLTPQDLPAPQDYILTPSPTPLLPIIPSAQDFDVEVVEMTRLDLANQIGVSPERLQLAKIDYRLYFVVECPTSHIPVPPPLSYGLEVTWIADDQTYTYLTWGEHELVWCSSDHLHGEYLTAIDPIAAELSALAIRRVSQQTDDANGTPVLVDIVPMVWRNSSMGCPQTGQDYAQMLIDGYRIVISEGETSYLFHTDSVQLVSCDFDRESN